MLTRVLSSALRPLLFTLRYSTPYMSSLAKLGLSEAKIKDTLKNVSLTSTLEDMISKSEGRGVALTKGNGTLLYSLATKLKKQEHLPTLLDLVLDNKIVNDVQLTAALEYIKANPVSLNLPALETACGVGVVVTEAQISELVADKLAKSPVLEQRYRYNTGPIMGQVRKELKWAEGGLIKSVIEKQVLELLGAKTAEDNKPVTKQKVKKEPVTAALKEPLVEKEPEYNFHGPGENYTTDGYVVTEHTMRLLKEHLEVTGGKVRTRFPPEPNGILHIGHAKAININFNYAKKNDGVCFLRYDDTNPEKEEAQFFDSIIDMITWLGFAPAEINYSSNNFQRLHDLAVKLINMDKAYVCHQTADEMKGFDPPPSPWRNRPVEESLKLFSDMRRGRIDEGKATLRMKCTLEEGKQDPVAYRIKFCAHHRTGDAWCIYPTYDFTHCLCDSFENITHSLCTKEFQTRRSSYYWLCNVLEQYCPVQWEYGRLNLAYTIMSKRKIAKLIEQGHLSDFDDPRLFTLTALRRRGFPPSAINNFVKLLGLTGATVQVDPSMLEACVRDELNVTAERVMVVTNPIEVKILDTDTPLPFTTDVPNIIKTEPDTTKTHPVALRDVFYIDGDDFREEADKNYRRLAVNQTVGLKHVGFVVTVKSVEKEAGVIKRLNVTVAKLSDTNKPKAFIQWVSDHTTATVRHYERLFMHKSPEDPEEVPGGFLTDINPNSLTVSEVLIEARLQGAVKPFTQYQFERIGFYTVDPDTTAQRLIFNNTVSLREDSGKT